MSERRQAVVAILVGSVGALYSASSLAGMVGGFIGGVIVGMGLYRFGAWLRRQSEPTPIEDTRGLGIGFMGFFAILVIAALLYILLNPAATDIFAMVTAQTSNQQAQDAIDRRETIWQSILFYPILLAGIMIIARAVFESRRPG